MMKLANLVNKLMGRQAPEAATPAPAAQKTPYKIGLNGTVEEFKNIPYGRDTLKEAIHGADKAFDEGRVENFQKLMELYLVSKDYHGTMAYEAVMATFCDKTAEQMKARLETLEEKNRQPVLDRTLCWSTRMGKGIKNISNTVETLVKAGADIHAYQEGALRFSAKEGMTYVVQFLHEKGADFKAALLQATVDNQKEMVQNLKAYQKHLTGVDADADPATAKANELMTQLLQQVKELTARVEKLAPQSASAAAKPDKPAAP